MCLRKIAEVLPRPLSANFELVAGTSTGAIIALGVALQKDTARVVDLFRKHGQQIFARRRLARIRKGSRYAPQFLRQVLTEVFDNARLKDCKTDVVVTATTLNNFEPRVFRNWTKEDVNPGRQPSPDRCPCGAMTRAAKRGHKCQAA